MIEMSWMVKLERRRSESINKKWPSKLIDVDGAWLRTTTEDMHSNLWEWGGITNPKYSLCFEAP